MDRNGVAHALISLAGPGVQVEPDAGLAVRRARQANDILAAEVAKNPRRFGGMAHLALQDPAAAAEELERCVATLGFKGAMVNGVTHGVYLDDPRYEGFWERAAALSAPIYIHPNNPADYPAMYAGHSSLWGPMWSWGVETATHAMRLVVAGVFARHPGARVILGHMGEAIPFQLWRLDSRWQIANRQGATLPRPPSAYVRENVFVTTSGVCSAEPLRCTLDALGEDRVMFSADYPFEDVAEASRFLDTVDVDEAVRAKIARGTAARLFGLSI